MTTNQALFKSLGAASLCASLCLLATDHARGTPQPIASDKAEVKFVSKQMNVPVDGRFKKVSGTLDFDPEKPETAKAQVSVDLTSIDMGFEDVEKEAQRPLWFNTAKFPHATFSSTAVKPAGPGKYEVAGKLTIKGITRDVTLPITLTNKPGGPASVDGALTIKRLDFKIGEGEWSDTETVANEVQIKFRMALPAAGR